METYPQIRNLRRLSLCAAATLIASSCGTQIRSLASLEDGATTTTNLETLSLSEARITTLSPTAASSVALAYGTVVGSYADYCLLENDTTLADCTWTAGPLPATYSPSLTDGNIRLSAWIRTGSTVSSRVDTNVVRLDHTAPTVASFSVVNPSPTSASAYVLSFGLVSEAVDSYCLLENDTNAAHCAWQFSSSLPSTYPVSLVENAKVLSFWVRDAVGNTSVRRDANSVTLDMTDPVVLLTSLSGGQVVRAGVPVAITWTASDANEGTTPISIYASSDGGANWSLIATSEANDGSYDWTPPAVTSTTYRVRVSMMDLAGNTARSSSGADFTVNDTSPVVDVTAPDGGEFLKGGAAKTITWTSTGLPAGASTAKLEYSLDGGTTWTSIAAGAPDSGTYAWTAPAATNTQQARIRVTVTDAFGIETASTSAADFTIDSTAPTLTLTSLTGGQTVAGGVSTTITWSGSDTNAGATPIGVEVSSDGGSTYSPLAAGEANDGTYTWAVPAVNSATYRVRITFTDRAGNSTVRASASDFTVNSSSPVVTVTSPNGGEYWRGGVAKNVTWTSAGLPGGASTAKIEYSLNDGVAWTTIASGVANGASNTYAWTLPAATDTAQAQVRVTVTDALSADTSDSSDTDFTIDSTAPSIALTSLTGGQTLTGGGTIAITWTASDTNAGATPISLEVSSDSGSTWSTIAANQADTGTYGWTIPSVTSKTYRVRATFTDLAGNTSSDASASDFWINSTTPSVAVTSPNGGEYWKGGSTHNLTWTSSGLPAGASTALLEYSLDHGASWTQIAAGQANGASNTYAWTLPTATDTAQAQVRVTVTDSYNVVTADASNADFTIDSTAPTVSLTSLTGGQAIVGAQNAAVTWTATDTNLGATPISLEYSTDSGGTWASLSASEANDGTYSWSVPAVDSTTYRLRVIATDRAGNSTASASASDFSILTTPPSIASVTITNANPTNSTTYQLSYGAVTGSYASYCILENDTTEADCGAFTAGTLPSSFVVSGANGAKVLSVWIEDAAGNLSTIKNSNSVTLDTVAPSLASAAITNANPTKSSTYGLAYGAVTGTYASYCILKNDTNLADCAFVAGTLPASYSVGATEGANTLSVWLKDAATNVSTRVDTGAVVLDTTPPAFTAGHFDLDGGVSPTINPNLAVSFAATDTFSNIVSACFKTNTTSAPNATDSCWTSVTALGMTASTSLSTTSASYTLPTVAGTYVLYGWLKDAAGNISALTNSGAGTTSLDKKSIDLGIGVAPTVTNAIAVSTDGFSFPLSDSDMTIAAGASVYVYWTASDNNALPAHPVSLAYTTDDTNSTSIVANLDNAGNGGCTVNSPYTGCYKWTNGSPASTYFKVRVSVTDASGMVTITGTNSVNTFPLRILAGNADLGTGSSATSALFFPNFPDPSYGDSKSLVVANDGTIYFKDRYRGILRIDPVNFTVSVLIPLTGATSPDGALASATLKNPMAIGLDFQGDLLVWDDLVIRKVDLANSTVTTIVGGGASSADTLADAKDLQLVPSDPAVTRTDMLFQPLPNGDLIFRNDLTVYLWASGVKIRHYHASGGNITTDTVVSSAGDEFSSTRDINAAGLTHSNWVSPGILYDSATSDITDYHFSVATENGGTWDTIGGVSVDPATMASRGAGTHVPSYPSAVQRAYEVKFNARNGDLYALSLASAVLGKYDATTHAFTTLVGTGSMGSCADDTAALSCNVTLHDAFVTITGRVYFVDGNRIRYVDSAGKVQTVGGQSLSFGDGGNPLAARFANIWNIDQWGAQKFVIWDSSANVIRELDASTGSLTRIAGNEVNADATDGATALTSPLTSYVNGYSMYMTLGVDASTGDVYAGQSSQVILRLTRSTGLWSLWAGGGSTLAASNNGNSALTSKYSRGPHLIGFDGTSFLIANVQPASGTNKNAAYYRVNKSTKVQTAFAGVSGTATANSFCANDTTDISACRVTYSAKLLHQTYDSTGTRWLAGTVGDAKIRILPGGGGNFGTLATLKTPGNVDVSVSSFAYRRTPDEIVYSCSTDGLLYKQNLTTNAKTELSLTTYQPGMKCQGNTLLYNSTRGSLVFPFTLHGVSGIAEWINP